MKRFRILHFFSLCVLLIFCCTACQNTTATTPNTAQNDISLDTIAPPVPSAPLTPSTSTAPPTESSPNEDIWDVSDIPNTAVAKGKKYIAFTFDDAPGKTLEPLLGVFIAFNEQHPDCPASATLFCNGIRCTASTLQSLQTAHLIGFEMGNHTQSHVDLTKLNGADLQREIQQTDKLLCAIDGKPHHLFRAPFGCVNEMVRAAAPTPIISWTIDTLDWTRVSAEHIYQSVWNGRFDGAIVLLHDGYPNTVTAVKRLLPDLYADGYQVLSISALSKANACPLKKGSVYIRARKNGNAR